MKMKTTDTSAHVMLNTESYQNHNWENCDEPLKRVSGPMDMLALEALGKHK